MWGGRNRCLAAAVEGSYKNTSIYPVSAASGSSAVSSFPSIIIIPCLLYTSYVEEFYDVSVDDIINKCIENVSYGEVPVDNNAAPEFIKGLANEDKSTSGDDLITYDVLLEVATLLSEQIGIIVNVEPHNRDNGRLPYSCLLYTSRCV